MPPKLIFLDVHGVLGDVASPGPEFSWPCVQEFNRIPDETGAKIILTSSLRELVHSGHMDLLGLGALLRSHGVHGELIGVIDTQQDGLPRWRLIARYLNRLMPFDGGFCWLILDDDFDARPTWTCARQLLIQTDPRTGLTAADADAAIAWLKD